MKKKTINKCMKKFDRLMLRNEEDEMRWGGGGPSGS